MKCGATRAFLSQISDREEKITPVPQADLDYLSADGYVLRTTRDEHDKGVGEVSRLSQIIAQVNKEKEEEEQADAALQRDTRKEHSFQLHFEGKEAKRELHERTQSEAVVVSREESELNAMEEPLGLYEGWRASMPTPTGPMAMVVKELRAQRYRA
jgi:hypothetical protein